jgi:hypothetical protein
VLLDEVIYVFDRSADAKELLLSNHSLAAFVLT